MTLTPNPNPCEQAKLEDGKKKRPPPAWFSAARLPHVVLGLGVGVGRTSGWKLAPSQPTMARLCGR